MKDKLRNFIESLFEDAPKNKQTIELKEEMLQNLIDKYNVKLVVNREYQEKNNLHSLNLVTVSYTHLTLPTT
mgnify:CR=1 FL=1